MNLDSRPARADLEKIGGLIKDIRIAMLSTLTAEGTLRSRPMATQDGAFTGQLWFFTSDDSGKVDEIYHQRQVGVTYANTSFSTYVSLSGTAIVVRDRAKAAELWKPILKAWFPGGVEDPHLVLLCVNVHDAEYWDAPAGKMSALFHMTKAALTGKPATDKVGEHGHVSLD